MDRIKRVTTAVTTISVGSAVIVGQQGAAWLTEYQAKFPPWWSPVAAVVLFFVTSQAVRIVLELALERITALRRFLLGDQFVEGVWFDLIFEGAALVSVGHSMIRYSDGKRPLPNRAQRIQLAHPEVHLRLRITKWRSAGIWRRAVHRAVWPTRKVHRQVCKRI
jgi:hypothetical protein